jgi:hypothetical protein
MPHADPEKRRAYTRAYRERNPEKLRKQSREHYWANREQILARDRERFRKWRELLKTIPVPRNGELWTPAEESIVMRDDITLIEICYLLGRSYGAVTGRRLELRRREKYGVGNHLRKKSDHDG